MSKKALGILLIVVGILGVVVSLEADAMGLGNGMGIGWKQGLGAALAVIIVAVGAWYWPGLPRSRMVGAGRKPRAGAQTAAQGRTRKRARRK